MVDSQIYKKIEEVVQKIGSDFKPDKIILFGSYAWGSPGPDSDVDLFIIKESEKTRIERERELHSLLVPRVLPLDILVYTPTELEEQINKKHNLFLEDIMRNGIVLYSKHGSREINITSTRPLILIP